MQHGCMERLNRKRGPQVWHFAGPRSIQAANVFTTRRLLVLSNTTRMRLLCGAP